MHVFLSFLFSRVCTQRGSCSQVSLAETMETGDRYRDVTYNIDSRDVKLFRNWLVYEFYRLKAGLCSSRALWPLVPNF